ncbi:MAG: hypothetical protein HYX60_03605 [Legionella longbeachae]|nr:hypothetical protein [Legionella longbeachae]
MNEKYIEEFPKNKNDLDQLDDLFEKLDLNTEKEYAQNLMEYLELLVQHMDNMKTIPNPVTQESIKYYQQKLDKIKQEKPTPPENLGHNASAFQSIILEYCQNLIKDTPHMLQEMLSYPLLSQRIILGTSLDTMVNHQQLELLKKYDESLSLGIGRLHFQDHLTSSQSAQDYFEYLLKNPLYADGHASLLYELIQLDLDSEKNRNALGNNYPDAYTVAVILETCRFAYALKFTQNDYDLIIENAKFSDPLSHILYDLNAEDILTRENFNTVMKYIKDSNEIRNSLKKYIINNEPILQEDFNMAIVQARSISIPSLNNQQHNLLWQENIIPFDDLQDKQKCSYNN